MIHKLWSSLKEIPYCSLNSETRIKCPCATAACDASVLLGVPVGLFVSNQRFSVIE